MRLTGEGAAVAVHGPGGVGKSELALEYAWLAGEQAAVDLLRLCAFLGPGPIPPSLLAADPEVLPPELAVAVCNKQALEATIAALYRLSLVGRDHDGLRLHRLVGGWSTTASTTNPGGPRQRSTWWLPVFQPMSPSRPAGRRVPGCCAMRWLRRITPTGWA